MREPYQEPKDLTEETREEPVQEGGKLGQYWKVACAVVYLSVCIFDFLIMPVVMTDYVKDIDRSEVYAQIANLDNHQAQVALIGKLEYNIQTWEPITLMGGGMFHIAFGAILTGAALKQGQIKTSSVKRSF
jgi:hypothetical protein